MNAICQQCGASELHWTIEQAEIHVGPLRHWKVQLCEKCRYRLVEAIREALRREGNTP